MTRSLLRTLTPALAPALALALLAPSAHAASTTLVSRAAGAGSAADQPVTAVAVAGSGRYVAFVSEAATLGAGGPGGGVASVYLRDRQTGALTLVSRAAGANGAAGNADSDTPSVSDDGRYVAFASNATNLVAGVTSGHHVYVRDLVAGTTVVADRADGATGTVVGGYAPSLSGDGKLVAFVAPQDPLLGTSTGRLQAAVRDLDANATTVVSRATGAGGAVANVNVDLDPALSHNGRYVAFTANATNLDPAASTNQDQIFLRDRATDTTTLISRVGTTGAAGSGNSKLPSVADDGTVAFSSQAANLRDGDRGNAFVRTPGGPTVEVSRDPGPTGAVRFGDKPVVSADGTQVAWIATSRDALTDRPLGSFAPGTVLRRAISGGHQLDAAVTALGTPFDGTALRPALSADGAVVAFASRDAHAADPAAPDDVAQALVRDTAQATPAATAAPSVAGTPRVGRPLTCLSGTWSGTPTALAYRWTRDGTEIAGATAAVRAATADDEGHALRCEVRATATTTGVALSAPVTIAAAAPAGTGAFEFLGSIGTGGRGGPGEFADLHTAAVAPDGNLVLLDRGLDPEDATAEVYTPGGTFLRAIGQAADTGPGSIRATHAMAASGDGSLAILQSFQVTRLTQDGYVLGSPDCGGDLNPSSSVAADAEGRIYVSGGTMSGPAIVVCAPDGTKLRTFPDGGTGTAHAIAVGPDDHLYVATDNAIRTFDAEGHLLRSFPVSGGTAALAVGPDGHIWRAPFSAKVVEYAPDGTELTWFGSQGSAPGQFFMPEALAVEPDGTVDVVDSVNNRLSRYRQVQGDPPPGGGGGGDDGPGAGGGGGGGGNGGGGTDAPPRGGGNIINIDVTAPTVEVLATPTRAQVRAGAPALTLRCSEACAVSAAGDLAVVRRTVSARGKKKATKATHKAIKASTDEKGKDKVIKGKPLPKPSARKAPTKDVRSGVTADGALAATAKLGADAATSVAIPLTAADRAEVAAALRTGTSALVSVDLTVADAVGNATTKSVDVRVVLR